MDTCKICGAGLEPNEHELCDYCKKAKEALKVDSRKTCFTELKPFDTFAKDGDFLEVTEWTNGEGFDLCLSQGDKSKYFGVTWGQFEALYNALLKLGYEPIKYC